MVPVSAAETIGLRRAMPRSKLKKIWGVLRTDAKALPADHKARYELLNGRLRAGDVFQVAEAVRDMAWRQKQVGSLTTQGKRIYEEAMRILSGEIAASQGIEMADAEAQVRARLGEILSSTTTM